MAKTIHHTVNITMIEAKLFIIKCGINQAIHITNTLYIIVITDAIHLAKKNIQLIDIFLSSAVYHHSTGF